MTDWMMTRNRIKSDLNPKEGNCTRNQMQATGKPKNDSQLKGLEFRFNGFVIWNPACLHKTIMTNPPDTTKTVECGQQPGRKQGCHLVWSAKSVCRPLGCTSQVAYSQKWILWRSQGQHWADHSLFFSKRFLTEEKETHMESYFETDIQFSFSNNVPSELPLDATSTFSCSGLTVRELWGESKKPNWCQHCFVQRPNLPRDFAGWSHTYFGQGSFS